MLEHIFQLSSTQKHPVCALQAPTALSTKLSKDNPETFFKNALLNSDGNMDARKVLKEIRTYFSKSFLCLTRYRHDHILKSLIYSK